MSLTIHVGAHKTASTHLQQTLRGLIPRMLAAGTHYSDVHHWRGGPARLTVALGEGEDAARLRKRLRRRLDVTAATWPEMVISEENILGSLRRESLMGRGNLIYPEARRRMGRLCGMLRHRPATICLAVREPCDFLTSAFSMQVMGGHELVLPDYLGGFDPARLSWTDLARRLLSLRGVARLVVWAYEDYAAVRPQILSAILPQALADRAGDPPPAIVGLSQPAYREVLALTLDRPDADLARIAREAKSRFPRDAGAEPLNLIDEATAARCRAAYGADMAQLARLPRTTLLRASGQ
ncbi:hypothetical protein H5395_05645 [Paracoccus sp. MC1854]|uniref:hypothetical protein n=1 Tax=Paracoccus sp. MC1854 TaxID=2760306 RepID=UPI0016026E7B|nr:hypothetical protein [Paracoccus sp. MC1854]MBB1491019.1 hypothetical protein [Paracoccus sp. MC1854]